MGKRKILITGASGFIGSAAVDKALELGYATWAGIRKNSNREYLQDERIHFIDLNYTDKEKLKVQLSELKDEHGRFDAIVHIAGLTKALRKSDFDRINYAQTKQFVEALIETEAAPDSFVYMSSLSALGPGDEIGYTPLCVDTIPAPNTAYGKSKLKTENWLKGIDGFPYLILRPTGVYGPRDRDYLILMKAVKNGFDITAGFKKQLLSFIYIEDLTSIIFSLIDKGLQRKEYLISDGELYTDSEFNRIVKDALGKKKIVHLKIPLFIVKPAAYISEKIAILFNKATTFNSDKYRIMKQRNWTCQIDPLKKDIDFQPIYKLNEGVKKTISWYKDQGWL